jgi:hypothetical protein
MGAFALIWRKTPGDVRPTKFEFSLEGFASVSHSGPIRGAIALIGVILVLASVYEAAPEAAAKYREDQLSAGTSPCLSEACKTLLGE